MARWKLTVESDDNGRARILLRDREAILSVTIVSWNDYARMCHAILGHVLETARDSIRDQLLKMIWIDAQRVSENSVELAKQRLLDLDWSSETINRYADELARELTQRLADSLPEVK